MSRNSEVFADYLLSLPQKVKSLREQAAALVAEADSAEAMLEHLDRSKLDCLKLTGNPKLDAALRLSMESGGYGGKYWLAAFPHILEKLDRMEKEIADWKEGGLMLADLTSQSSCPICFHLVILEVSANPILQIMPTRGYFHNIPLSVRIPGRLLMVCNSNTWVMGMEHCTDLSSAEYEVTSDGFKMVMVDAEHRVGSPIANTFDLTQLLHPNWGTRNVRLAGIILGEQAIERHIEKWRAFINKGYCMRPSEAESYLKFLDEFLGAVQGLTRIVA